MAELLLYAIVVLCVAGLASMYLRKPADAEPVGEFTADYDALAAHRRSAENARADHEAEQRIAAAKFGRGALREGAEL